MRIVGFDLRLEQAATLEVQKDSHGGMAETFKMCGIRGFLSILTPDDWLCATSKADSSEERNPIPQDYCTGRAAEDRRLLVSF